METEKITLREMRWAAGALVSRKMGQKTFSFLFFSIFHEHRKVEMLIIELLVFPRICYVVFRGCPSVQ